MKKIYIIGGVIGIVVLISIGIYLFLVPNDNKVEYTEVLVNDNIVTSLYNMVNPSDEVTLLYDRYHSLTFTDEYILGCALALYDEENSGLNQTLSADDVLLYVHKIFGDISYENTSGSFTSDHFTTFTYDENTNTYQCRKESVENNTEFMVRKVIAAKKTRTDYIITEKSIVVAPDHKEIPEESSLTIYDDVSHSNTLDVISYTSEDYPTVSIENYIDQAETYEYHFTFDGENFVLKSFQKVANQ